MRVPDLTDPNLAEEIGIHIGDGSMNIYKCYLYSLRGHRKDDETYYKKFIPNLYKKVYRVNVHIRKWPDVIGFQLGSKDMILFKNKIVGLPLGSKINVSIPDFILNSKTLFCRCLRGIFDTDGCLTFERKSRKLPYYPRIMFSTTSRKLHKQLIELLSDKLGFNLSSWSKSYKYKKWNDLYIICIRGERNTNKWFQLIGSSNIKNNIKYQYWKKHGYARVA